MRKNLTWLALSMLAICIQFSPNIAMAGEINAGAGAALALSPSLFPANVADIPAGVLYAPTTDFQAKLICASDKNMPKSNVWQAFRKTFDLDAVPGKAICRIVCDTKYWLMVNGESVVYEGGLKRGPSPKDSYYDEIDLKPFLKQGENEILIETWFFGKPGFSHVDSGQPGLIFDATTNGDGGLYLISDKTWDAACLTKTSESGAGQPFEAVTDGDQPNYRLPESNVRFDARRNQDFPYVGSAEIADANGSAWGQFYKRPIPQWKDYGFKTYVSQTVTTDANGNCVYSCTLPYNAQVTPYLHVEARGGELIDIRTDNYQGGGPANVRHEYVCCEGEQEQELPGWFNGNKVLYTMPKSVKVLALEYRETGFAAEFAGTFCCDDEFCNKLYTKAVRTLYITMRDTFYDCPDRERAQWWGDAVNEMGEAFYALSREADQLPHKGFYELLRFQKPTGAIFSPVPAGNYSSELPAQMLATVSTKGLGVYQFYSGDYSVGIDLFPRILRYLACYEFEDDGLVKTRKGDWSWGDWGDNIDLRVLINEWYYMAATQALETAERIVDAKNRAELNDAIIQRVATDPKLVEMAKAAIPALKKQLESIEKNFDRVFWDGKQYRDPQYKGQTDDRANSMAVVARLAKKENYPALFEVLKTQKHASPYMEKYVLEALYLINQPDYAIERLKERFTEMVDAEGLTTLWEGWGLGDKGFGGGTMNHAWSGGGLTCLLQYAVGLEPVKPAFKEFKIQPQMGPLNKMETSTPTKFGRIVVKLEKLPEGAVKLNLTVPEGTVGFCGQQMFKPGAHEFIIK